MKDPYLSNAVRFLAFDQHATDGHNADFEVCLHPKCQRAWQQELTLVKAGLMVPLWEHEIVLAGTP